MSRLFFHVRYWLLIAQRGLLMKIVNFLSLVDRDKCIGDRLCEKACPTSAIKVIEKKARVDEERCVACTKCVEV